MFPLKEQGEKSRQKRHDNFLWVGPVVEVDFYRSVVRNRTGSENLTLAIPSPHSIPWRHGNPAGITTGGVGMDPTRGASLYSGAGSGCGDLDIHGPRVTGAGRHVAGTAAPDVTEFVCVQAIRGGSPLLQETQTEERHGLFTRLHESKPQNTRQQLIENRIWHHDVASSSRYCQIIRRLEIHAPLARQRYTAISVFVNSLYESKQLVITESSTIKPKP